MKIKRFYLNDTVSYIRFCQRNPLWQNQLKDVADKACGNTFIFTDRYEMERSEVPYRFEDRIDWNCVPWGDPEWCFALNRHTFLLNLAKAYALTHDEKYRSSFIRLFTDFAANASDEKRERSWRSLETGIRVENYIRSLEFFEDTKPLDEGFMQLVHDMMLRHQKALVEAHNDFHVLSNWGVLQDHGLLLASLYLEDEETARLALSRLDQELRLQVMSDGMHWEQSSLYQAEVLHCALDSILAARRFALPVPESLEKNAKSLAVTLARTVRPDGRCYLFGDSDDVDVSDMLLEAAVLFDDSFLAWAGRSGKDEDFYASFPLDVKLPEARKESRTHYFGATGNAVIELKENSELRFHCGLYGSGHGHLDQLHFDLLHRGQLIFTDSGRYTYVDSPERTFFKGSFSHNTVVIDNSEMAVMHGSWDVEKAAEPLVHDARLDGEYKFISASHLGYLSKGVLVTRSLITIEDKYILIADSLRGTGTHTSLTLFHSAEDASVTEEDGICRIEKNGAAAYLYPLSCGKCTVRDSRISLHYNEMADNKEIRAERTFTDSCLSLTLIALDSRADVRLVPVTKPLSGTVFDKDTAQAVRIKDSSAVYTVSCALAELPNSGFLSEADGAKAYARVYVKKDGEEPVILKY